MGRWIAASDKLPPASCDFLSPVWVCLGNGAIASAIFKRAMAENAGSFYTLEGFPVEGVTQWMPRQPDRIPPHPG